MAYCQKRGGLPCWLNHFLLRAIIPCSLHSWELKPQKRLLLWSASDTAECAHGPWHQLACDLNGNHIASSSGEVFRMWSEQVLVSPETCVRFILFFFVPLKVLNLSNTKRAISSLASDLYSLIKTDTVLKCQSKKMFKTTSGVVL